MLLHVLRHVQDLLRQDCHCVAMRSLLSRWEEGPLCTSQTDPPNPPLCNSPCTSELPVSPWKRWNACTASRILSRRRSKLHMTAGPMSCAVTRCQPLTAATVRARETRGVLLIPAGPGQAAQAAGQQRPPPDHLHRYPLCEAAFPGSEDVKMTRTLRPPLTLDRLD